MKIPENIHSVYYNNSIDVIKGILMILVILGHILLGDLDSNIIRFIIYSFHMPVFFFISGYLLNINNIQSFSVKDFVSKYYHRMLKEWGVALIIYTLGCWICYGFSIRRIINPYYHLWYIPSLFISIVSVWISLKYAKSRTLLFLILFCIGIFFFNFSNYYDIGQTYNCRLFVFLILGIISRKYFKNINSCYFLYLFIFLLVLIWIFYYSDNAAYVYKVYFQMPLCFFALCINFSSIDSSK